MWPHINPVLFCVCIDAQCRMGGGGGGLKFCSNIWKTAEKTKKKVLEIVYRTEAVSHV